MIIEVSVAAGAIGVLFCMKWWWNRRQATRKHRIIEILYSINGGQYSPVSVEENGDYI